MITKLKIENYKSIDSLELDFKPATILVGIEACGKTTLLEVLNFLKSLNMALPFDYFKHYYSDNDTKIYLECEIKGNLYQYELQLSWPDPFKPLEIVLESLSINSEVRITRLGNKVTTSSNDNFTIESFKSLFFDLGYSWDLDHLVEEKLFIRFIRCLLVYFDEKTYSIKEILNGIYREINWKSPIDLFTRYSELFNFYRNISDKELMYYSSFYETLSSSEKETFKIICLFVLAKVTKNKVICLDDFFGCLSKSNRKIIALLFKIAQDNNHQVILISDKDGCILNSIGGLIACTPFDGSPLVALLPENKAEGNHARKDPLYCYFGSNGILESPWPFGVFEASECDEHDLRLLES